LKAQQAQIKEDLDIHKHTLEGVQTRGLYLDHLARWNEIDEARKREVAMKVELDGLNLALANPESQIANLESQIDQAKRERKRLEDLVNVIETDLKALQNTLTTHSKDFDLSLVDWVKMQEQPVPWALSH